MIERIKQYAATLEPTQQELRIRAQLEQAVAADSLAAKAQSKSSGRRYKVNEKGQMERIR